MQRSILNPVGLWHKNGMRRRDDQQRRRPLDAGQLRTLALAYVGRFATTRGKLADYLTRKLRERGWAEGDPPDLDALTGEFTTLGYVDDAGFAAARAQALHARGYGARRIAMSLKAARIADDAIAPLLPDDAAALAAAETFARRKRFGPYAPVALDAASWRRQAAAMARAGHSFDVIRAVLNRSTGDAGTS